jgi:molybdenum cofactor cytidylyltransferase
MISSLRKAFRLKAAPQVALVGAGGKTTALFRLAGEYPPPVVVTTTTHLGIEQLALGGRHIVLDSPQSLEAIETELPAQVLMLTGPATPDGSRWQGLDSDLMELVRQLARRHGMPLLIEADGSRRLPLKAPAEHEPAIPGFVDTVIVVAGLEGVGKALDGKTVHRPEIFAPLSGISQGETITVEALERVIRHPAGGLKNIPAGARRMALLNGADSPELQEQGHALAERLLADFEAAAVASLGGSSVDNGEKDQSETGLFAVHERVAGIILAAGAGERMGGQVKLLLPWRGEPLVRIVARMALESGLKPVVVVTGAHAHEIQTALNGLAVELAHNPDWQAGQSTSVRVGIDALPGETGAVVFLLGDQPQTPSALVRALKDEHARSLAAIVAPVVGSRRTNPVLFDRDIFADLHNLQGDAGGRQLFERYGVHHLSWEDERQLWDVDTPDDYQKLLRRVD